METLTITKPQLEAALLRWVHDAREGKTLTNEEAAELTAEQSASMSADGLWRDLVQQVPNA
jgi:hypothetical protein